jgi:GH24 family phage-related lysozyme (muramidase)
MDMGQARAWISRWEGRRNQTYIDSQGHPTVGVGFNLDAAGASAAIAALGLNYNQVRSGQQSLTDAQIDTLLDGSLATALQGAQRLIAGFNTQLSNDRQIVVVDMVFNLGAPKFSQFVQTIQAINNQDWATAAQQMQQSAWYGQVGNRSKADVAVMSGQSTVADYI